MNEIAIVIVTIIILIIIIFAVYKYYPKSIMYIPEVAKLDASTKRVEVLLKENKALNSTLTLKQQELMAQNLALESQLKEKQNEIIGLNENIAIQKTMIEKTSAELATIKELLADNNKLLSKANADLTLRIKELNDIRLKYNKLNSSTIRLVDVELSNAAKLLVASTQRSINDSVNASPEIKASFQKLYLSLINLGLVMRGELCANKTDILKQVDMLMNVIKNSSMGTMLCDKAYINNMFTEFKRNLLYRRIYKQASTSNVIITKPGGDYIDVPLYNENVISATSKSISDASEFLIAIMAQFCKTGKFDTVKFRNMVVHELDKSCQNL